MFGLRLECLLSLQLSSQSAAEANILHLRCICEFDGFRAATLAEKSLNFLQAQGGKLTLRAGWNVS